MARVKAENKTSVSIPKDAKTKELKVEKAPGGIVKSPIFAETDDSETFLNQVLELANDDLKNASRIFQRGVDSVMRTISVVLTPEEKTINTMVKNLGITKEKAAELVASLKS